MQSFHDRRRPCAASRGVSLVELLVVLVVLTLAATIARVSLRRDARASRLRHFVADVRAAVVQARDAAIDRGQPVQLDVDATSVRLGAWDPATDTWRPLHRVTRDEPPSGLDGVCVEGLAAGVAAPSQAGALAVPPGCLDHLQRLRFEPDGTFSLPWGEPAVDNAGVTLWIGDADTGGAPVHALVQVFPGGLVFVHEEVI